MLWRMDLPNWQTSISLNRTFASWTKKTLCRYLTVNSMWGGFREKIGKYNRHDFSQVLPKSSWTTFKIIFETLSALGACHMTITGRVVYKKSMIFEVSWAYLSEFLIFLHEIFFGSKILQSTCDKHQKFDYGCNQKDLKLS